MSHLQYTPYYLSYPPGIICLILSGFFFPLQGGLHRFPAIVSLVSFFSLVLFVFLVPFVFSCFKPSVPLLG